MSDAPLRVFISYARADSTDFVNRLEQDLLAQQFVPWVDRHGLEGGQAWLDAIQQAIDESGALVVVLSPAAVQSQYVHLEYHYAQEEGKQVIPVIWQAVKIPFDLRLTHCLDFQPDYTDGLHQLVQALGRLRTPAAPLAPPAEPPAKAAPPQAVQPTRQEQLTSLPQGPPQKTKEQWKEEGNKLLNAQKYQEALAAYERALQLDLNFVGAWYNKGLALYRLKRSQEALVAFERALQLDSNDTDAWMNKGNALHDLMREAEALAAHEQAIRLDPRSGMFHNNKGLLLQAMGRAAEAEQAFKKARELGYRG